MMRRAARRDTNHAALVEALRDAGLAVSDLGGVGGGVPDLYVSRAGRGLWVEIKAPKGGKPRGAQQAASLARQAAWRDLHSGCVVVAHTLQDVLEAFSDR